MFDNLHFNNFNLDINSDFERVTRKQIELDAKENFLNSQQKEIKKQLLQLKVYKKLEKQFIDSKEDISLLKNAFFKELWLEVILILCGLL